MNKRKLNAIIFNGDVYQLVKNTTDKADCAACELRWLCDQVISPPCIFGTGACRGYCLKKLDIKEGLILDNQVYVYGKNVVHTDVKTRSDCDECAVLKFCYAKRSHGLMCDVFKRSMGYSFKQLISNNDEKRM